MTEQITVKDFPRYLEISKSRRAKYYTMGGSKKVPLKYQDISKFRWIQHTKRGKKLLTEIATGEKVIANPKVAGTPRMMKIGGQAILNGSIHPNVRNKMFQMMKQFFLDSFIENGMVPFKEKEFPLKIEGKLYMPLFEKTNSFWDVDNMQIPYLKAFQDALVAGGYIPDDHMLYICKPLGFEFIPSTKYKMVINFSTSKRKLWKKIYEKFKIFI